MGLPNAECHALTKRVGDPGLGDAGLGGDQQVVRGPNPTAPCQRQQGGAGQALATVQVHVLDRALGDAEFGDLQRSAEGPVE